MDDRLYICYCGSHLIYIPHVADFFLYKALKRPLVLSEAGELAFGVWFCHTNITQLSCMLKSQL